MFVLCLCCVCSVFPEAYITASAACRCPLPQTSFQPEAATTATIDDGSSTAQHLGSSAQGEKDSHAEGLFTATSPGTLTIKLSNQHSWLRQKSVFVWVDQVPLCKTASQKENAGDTDQKEAGQKEEGRQKEEEEEQLEQVLPTVKDDLEGHLLPLAMAAMEPEQVLPTSAGTTCAEPEPESLKVEP